MTDNLSGSIYLCVKQFNARLGDELNLKIGDKVEVLTDDSEYNDGWYMGRNLLTNDVGLYPKTFTQLLHTPKNPDTLLRSRSRRLATPPNSNSTTSVNKVTEAINNLSVDKSNASTHSVSTSASTSTGMTEIDRALKELQNSPKQSLKNSILPNSSLRSLQTNSGSQTPSNQVQSSDNVSSADTSTHNGSSSTHNLSGPALPSKPNGNGNRLSTQSLTEDLDPLDALNWTPQQVSTYFAIVLGFDLSIAGKFARHKITGPILFELDLAHLKELDIDSFGTRFEVHKEIEKLKKAVDSGVAPDSASAIRTPGQPGNGSHRNDSILVDNENDLNSRFGGSPQKSFPYGHNKSSNNSNSNLQPPSEGNTSNYSDADTSYSSNNTTNVTPSHAKSALSLMPSAPLTSSRMDRSSSRGNDDYLKAHQRKRSQSMENIPQQVQPNEDDEISTPDKRKSMAFLSPRKAPVPPTAPSPLNKTYKFGGATPDPENTTGHMYMTRTNASNAGLGITNVNGLSRPASSIYDNSLLSHGRKESQTSNGYQSHHRRNSSTQGSASGHHRRHSSLFSFLSNNEDLTLNGEKMTPKQQTSGAGGTTPTPNNRNSTFFGSGTSGGLGIGEDGDYFKSKNTTNNALISPANIKPETPGSSSRKSKNLTDIGSPEEPIDIDRATLSPKKSKSVSYRGIQNKSSSKLGGSAIAPPAAALDDEKRSASDSNAISRLKTLRTTSTQNFKNLTTSKKSKTSAFQEGIRHITPDDAIKSANYSGWMSKKSGSNIGWRSRYFTLHGTRLSYFTSLKDKRERGLIDITAHKVIPVNTEDSANSNDKYIAMYASSTGFGRYCFKIVPPAPGFKKGLTFTQPKTHYFAVESQEDMRGWLKALMTATIDIDDTVPVVSSCSTPTVTLGKAQELLAKAREETKLKDEELRAQGYYRDGYDYKAAEQEQQQQIQRQSSTQDPKRHSSFNMLQSHFVQEDEFTSEENSPVLNEGQLDRLPSSSSRSRNTTSSLSIDTNSFQNASNGSSKTPTTPQFSNQGGGFASPYLLASGLLSPKSGSARDSTVTMSSAAAERERAPQVQSGNTSLSNVAQSPASSQGNKAQDYLNTGETTPKSIFSNSNGRVVSGSKKKSEKMLAYSNDGSGNYSFTIKQKK